jgi:ElaB/YqjD/DUF883 family membrane-anchored ribosome-binding protein
MLFNDLSSDLMKQALVAKMQYSLGYKMIAAVLRAANPVINFETKAIDDTFNDAAKLAKKTFASYQDFVHTNGYQVDSITQIIESYVKGTGLNLTQTPKEVLDNRAKLSGRSVESLKSRADAAREVQIAKKQEEINKLAAEFQDITIYANAYYNHNAAIGNNDHNADFEDTYVDIEDILVDSWVIDTYPKCVKSQEAFWSRYNNYDDAEIVLILADNDLIASISEKRKLKAA